MQLFNTSFNQLRRARRRQSGFTIVELLIVVVVIAILAAISIVSYTGIQQQARDSVRKSDAALIAKSLRLWSYNTGTQFSSMNAGNGAAANGWFDSGYSATPSVRDVLMSSKLLSNGSLDDPMRSNENSQRWRYMIAPCTAATTDNRRVVLVELENAPSQTIPQQLSSHGCDSAYLSSYATSYKVNYAQLADAR